MKVRTLAALTALVLVVSGTALAQFGQRGRFRGLPMAAPDSFDGRFQVLPHHVSRESVW